MHGESLREYLVFVGMIMEQDGLSSGCRQLSNGQALVRQDDETPPIRQQNIGLWSPNATESFGSVSIHGYPCDWGMCARVCGCVLA